jgi:ribosomal protein L37AE/L43A
MTNQVDTEGIQLQEAVLKALRNMGHDTTCGACMSVAFTGTSTGIHTCKKAKYLTATGPDGGMLGIDVIIKALEEHPEEFEGAADHLFFLQAVIATNLKDIGMPKDVYLEGCEKAWDTDDELQVKTTIPRNTH